MNMILAFGHKARQGKDLAGEAIVSYYESIGHYAKVFKFAEALYTVCRTEYGMVEKDSRLLQKIGDGRRVEFGEDYWIRKLEDSMKDFSGIKVITDLRYINEAWWVKDLGGFTINVSRLNQDGTPFITNDRDPNFISEVQLDHYNYDFYLKAKTGHSDLLKQQAIVLARYVEYHKNQLQKGEN